MRTFPFLAIAAFLLSYGPWVSIAEAKCVKEYENLCILPSANLSRINRAPKVLEAAKAYAKKMKPYGLVMVTSGYRDAKGQRAKQASGVQAGAASGSNMSAHIYGVAKL